MMGSNFTRHPEYDNLPDPIKSSYSAEEYSWMTDEQRASLLERECLPDDMGDD
jgi:hypothetical protein